MRRSPGTAVEVSWPGRRRRTSSATGSLTGKQGSVRDNDLATRYGVYHMVCPNVVSRVTRWVYPRRNGEIWRLGRSPLPRRRRRVRRRNGHSISSRDGSSSPPTQNVPPRSPRRGRGSARGRRPSCIPSQVSGVEPKAFDSRIAISTEILVRPFTGSESACRVPPSPWAARVTVKSASLSGRRSRQGDLVESQRTAIGGTRATVGSLPNGFAI